MLQSRIASASRPKRNGLQTFDTAAVSVTDAAHVRGILIASARLRRSITYAELLEALGHSFDRQKMRAVCKTLDVIDGASRMAGEPEMAVLVVKAADGLPGAGWWAGERPQKLGYTGPLSGPEAAAFVQRRQTLAFDYWS